MKTYNVNTQTEIVRVQAETAIEAIKIAAEGRKISGKKGTLTVRTARISPWGSDAQAFWVRRSSEKTARERWVVTEVVEVAEVTEVEAPIVAEVIADQVEVTTDSGMTTIDIIAGNDIDQVARQFAIDADSVGADAKYLVKLHAERIAKAAGTPMGFAVAQRIRQVVTQTINDIDNATWTW